MGGPRPVRIEALILAAGRSTRFEGGVPKQYLALGDRTVLERSIDAITGHPSVRAATVVLPSPDLDGPIARRVAARVDVQGVVAGGASRAASCLAGLEAMSRASHVLVHDAARPFVSVELVDRVVAATRARGAAVPVVAIHDTVKRLGPKRRVVETIERATLGAAQTPQGARRDWLLDALRRSLRDGFVATDEASALERAGREVVAVDGEQANRKLTTAADLPDDPGGAASDWRVGHGFDVHRFRSGRPLVLGGTRIEGEVGLEGHSDADVVLHALMDAVLGAAALGDIGEHFPPSDPAYRGASSVDLARRVATMVRDDGWSIVNVDATLLAERPKIGPVRDAMRRSIATTLGIGVDRVGLKATTLERLGALGRSEGMACEAVALLRRAGRSR